MEALDGCEAQPEIAQHIAELATTRAHAITIFMIALPSPKMGRRANTMVASRLN
jgi:hypothetical protein